jgi:hypothetical protein
MSARSSYRILAEQDELNQHLLPVLKANGSEIPTPGAYFAVVEFDDAGEVIAYQMIQRAVFLEGMWARDKTAHFRSIWNIAHDFLRENHATGVMTFARNDTKLGLRIGRVAERMGCEKMPLSVYRRMF